jgi:hypothetical protein
MEINLTLNPQCGELRENPSKRIYPSKNNESRFELLKYPQCGEPSVAKRRHLEEKEFSK